jgi:hypothetical protein
MNIETIVLGLKRSIPQVQAVEAVPSRMFDLELLAGKEIDELDTATGSNSVESIADGLKSIAQIDQLYPHVFDSAAVEGRYHAELVAAFEVAEQLNDLVVHGDLIGVSECCSQLAVRLKTAQADVQNNDALGMAISYIKRAVLAADVTAMNVASVQSLVNGLRVIVENPLIDLADAAELSDNLLHEGWNGTIGYVRDLVAGLLAPDVNEHVPEQQEHVEA